MREVLATILLLIILSTCYFSAPRTVFAVKQDYDYKALALDSILGAAEEASKLPDIEQRVLLVIEAVRMLPSSRLADKKRLLEICLRDLKGWLSDDKKSGSRYNTANRLRSEVLSEYAKLDPEKASALQKDDPLANTSSGDITTLLRPGGKWAVESLTRRGPADQMTKMALSIIDSDPERAYALVIESLKDGVVSNSINAIFQKLEQDGKRDLVSKLQVGISQALASRVTLDFFSLGFAAHLLFDEGMSPTVRSGFIRFLMNSLETWTALVRGEDGNGGLDSSYVGSSFTTFFLNVRPAIAKYSPEDLLRLDLLFDQASAFVPEKTKSTLQTFQPEALSDPKDRLADILEEPNSDKRDLRLVRLVSDILRRTEKDLDLASDVISHFNDQGLKRAFGDFLQTIRLNSLVKAKDFIDAQRVAGSISSELTRTWAMLALADAARGDHVLAFELTNNALKTLNSVSPTPAKVQLALMATAQLVMEDPQRSFETLSLAARYSNSTPSTIEESGSGLSSAVGLEASIGNQRFKLARGPKRISDVEVDPVLSGLARSDWFRSQSLANDFGEPMLRLSLKLHFANSVLTAGTKQKKPATEKRSSK